LFSPPFENNQISPTMKYLYLSLIFSLSFQLSFAHNNPIPRLADIQKMAVSQVKKKADNRFELEDYQDAFYYYFALSKMKRKLNKKLRYRLGKTALHAEEYQIAIQELKPLLKKDRKFPLIRYEYGKALKNKGHYKSAKAEFEHFIANQINQDQPYVKLAKLHIKSCDLAIEAKAHPSSFAIGSVGTDFEKEDGNIRSMTTVSKNGYRLIEYQEEGRGSCIKRVTPDMKIEDLGSSVSNPVFNSGCPHIAADGETVFFVRQESSSATSIEYKIYQARINEEGEIVDIEKLGSEINKDGYSSIYPSLGVTEKGQEVLYFSSTLPGGEGGYDIWYAVRLENGSFTRAYNLGSRINTPEDEITPFYYQEGGELYYSSNRPEGYGGFDIYQMTGEKRRWMQDAAEHLGYPINSEGNDTHFVKDKNEQGFFTTDRDGKAKTFRQSEQPAVVEP
jgi:tetratricopeptide (TPR) repeat protein